MGKNKCENCDGRGLVSEKETCVPCRGSGKINSNANVTEKGEEMITGLTIGRIVHYRSRTGKYTVPAIVTATVDTLYMPGVEGGHISDLGGINNVHLTVFTPGYPGKRANAKDFETVQKNDTPLSENVAGCYQEWDVPHGELDAEGNLPAGTWAFPQR